MRRSRNLLLTERSSTSDLIWPSWRWTGRKRSWSNMLMDCRTGKDSQTHLLEIQPFIAKFFPKLFLVNKKRDLCIRFFRKEKIHN